MTDDSGKRASAKGAEDARLGYWRSFWERTLAWGAALCVDEEWEPTSAESARRKIAEARERGGPMLEAVVRGRGCCMVNDPEFDQALWDDALAEYALLLRASAQSADRASPT